MLKQKPPVDLDDMKKALGYIDELWMKLERFHPHDDATVIGLPKPYLVPAQDSGNAFSFNELYYWDSWFMVQGILDVKHKELVAGILEDLLVLMKRFHVIPNASRTYFTGRSHPPVLTNLIFDVYKLKNESPRWLEKAMNMAKEEYRVVWMSSEHPHWRQVYKGLSRYYDVNVLHDLAEAESGWDMTTRFGRKCLHFLPVDLNSFLYKYETDFATAAELLGNLEEAQNWHDRAKSRKHTMHELMWDKSHGFYFDYNFKKEKRGSVWSLAGFYPMWAGMVSRDQAEQMVAHLHKFMQPGGLSATTAFIPLPGALPTQWAYPNGWAPLHFIVVEGLRRYGYHAEAEKVAKAWLQTCTEWFVKHHVFLEKYNVVKVHREPVEGLYPSQTGFGWTNSIYVRFCKEYYPELFE